MAKMANIDELARLLKGQDDIVLIGHLSPDGDATGSCLAL